MFIIDRCYILFDFNNIRIAYIFRIGPIIQFDEVLADKGIDVYNKIGII